MLIVEFRLQGRLNGLPWGEVQRRLVKGVIPDIYYPDERMIVEIDTGTESHTTLRSKAERYSKIRGLRSVVFVTTGALTRGQTFLVPLQETADLLIQVKFQDLPKLFRILKKEFRSVPFNSYY